MISYALANTVETMADLRGYPMPQVNNYAVQMLGYHAAGDGGCGIFVWQTASAVADDGGLVIAPTSAPANGRWYRMFANWDWTVNASPNSIGQVNVKWWGAKGDATTSTTGTDDTAYIQACFVACCKHGTLVDVFFPCGNYRVTSTLKMPATCTKFVLIGEPSNTLRPDYNPDGISVGSRIHCKEITGATIDHVNAVEGGGQTCTKLTTFSLQGLTFDGGNSEGPGHASTTWTGVFLPGQSAVAFHLSVTLGSVSVIDCATVAAKGLDLSGAFWVLVEKCMVANFLNGYGLFISTAGISSTTITIRKTWFESNLECMYLGSNTYNITLDDVIFESSFIALASYLSYGVDMRGCWFENMGRNPGTQPTALSLKGFTTGDPVDTVIYGRANAMRLENCTLAYACTGTPLVGFIGVDGARLASSGSGGSVSVINCSGGPNTIPLFSPGSDPASNGGYVIRAEQLRQYDQNGSPRSAVNRIADARVISDGLISVVFGTGDARIARVSGGLFMYGVSVDKLSGPLTDAPVDGVNLAGDRVHVSAPAAGTYSEYVCVTAGTIGSPVGTWKGVGPVQA